MIAVQGSLAPKLRCFWTRLLGEICAALIRGEFVSLRSFGTFNVRAKRERIGRNPKNGVAATICARRVISFLPSPILVAHVNGESRQESRD